ncbi:MAG: hypothetical protein P8169_16340, partial [Chloroflexota bacterium]
MLAYYRGLTTLRQSIPALRRGTFENLYAQGQVYGFRRVLTAPEAARPYEALVLVNAGHRQAVFDLPLPTESAGSYIQAWPEADITFDAASKGSVQTLEITLPAREGLVLVN